MSKDSKLRVPHLRKMKQAGEKIVSLTAYDASFAHLLDAAGVDAILVGDSLGMVIQGAQDTLGVGMAEMIYHCRIVANGRTRALLIVDMPFMSYAHPSQALGNAGRLISEGGAEMVKLEGGREMCETVRLLTERGIPVCGHLGLTPQSVHALGGHQMRGKDEESAQRILEDTLLLQDAGATLLVLESIPASLAAQISENLSIPTIGINSGRACDGQIMVLYDILGISLNIPKIFSKIYLDGKRDIPSILEQYVKEVRCGDFPHERKMRD
ncbi:MAG: 3-methyl-2-oxobutanoate hydroxymethyltransferase [Candidatus Eutrophobiaceae bacterium]